MCKKQLLGRGQVNTRNRSMQGENGHTKESDEWTGLRTKNRTHRVG